MIFVTVRVLFFLFYGCRAQRIPGPPPVCLYGGADVPDADHPLGYTPLMLATSLSQLQMVQRMVDCGHNVNAVANDGFTPFYLAMKNGWADLIKFLLDNGADLHYSHPNPEYLTAIYYASVQAANLEMVSWLLDLGAVVNVYDSKGYTPLWYAVQGGHLALATDLLDHGAIINAAGFVDSRNRNMLWYAVDLLFYGLVDLLILRGIDKEVRDDRGLTPLAYAAMKNRFVFVNRLIDGGANAVGLLDTVILNYDYDTMDYTYILAICDYHPTRPGCPDPLYPDTYYEKKITVRDVLISFRYDDMVTRLETAAR